MRKLLALLVFMPSLGFSDPPPTSQNGRYAVSGDIIVDTRTGKAWQAATVQGSGAFKMLLPLSYISPGDKIPTATDKSFTDMLIDGSFKLIAEPPH